MGSTNFFKAVWKSMSPYEDGLHSADLLKVKLEEMYQTRVFPVNAGRSALYLLLKAAGIGEENEVIIQAYTCNAVPNPILWTGAVPIYVDIEKDTLNINPSNIEEKINSKTRAIVLQHTFGRPGPIKEVLELAKKHNIYVFEDCAHSLGTKFEGKYLGTWGDGAILSFGREKVIPSIAGGAVVIKNDKLMKPIIKLTSDLDPMPVNRLTSEYINFFTWRAFLRRIYFNDTGYKTIKNLNEYDFFNVVLSEKEKEGRKPAFYPATIPNAFAQIILEELPHLETFNNSRREIANFYYEKLSNDAFIFLPKHDGSYLRFVLFHKEATKILKEARVNKFWFGNWYDTPVYPAGVDLNTLGYQTGSCPNAEKFALQTINLPNYLGMSFEEAGRVVEFINNYKS